MGGGQGGHGPRAQALEGAPAQLVGPNCKKKSNGKHWPPGAGDPRYATGFKSDLKL